MKGSLLLASQCCQASSIHRSIFGLVSCTNTMRTLSTIALSLLAVQAADAASAGCGKAPPSSGVKTVTVNGRQRQYILQLPNNYDRNKPHRVVFGFHWLGGSMNDVANNNFYDLRSRGASNTIFVAPNGLDAGWANTGGQDIAFVDQIVASLKNDLCVDEGQFFATGFSYGGAMSHSVACSRPSKLDPWTLNSIRGGTLY